MPGVRALRGAQFSNVEGTVGTAEAATEVMLFENLTFKSDPYTMYMPKQDRASLAANIETPFPVSQFIELEADGSLYDRLANFMFSNSIRGNITPAAVGGGETLAYTWTYEPALGTPNTPDETNGIDTFTAEWFDNLGEFETSYIFTQTLELSGAPNEDVKFNWSMGGRGATASTKTAALTAPSAKYYAQNQTKWFVDANYAGIGGTQITDTLKAWKWTFETMFTPRFTADGQLYFTALNEDAKKLEIELTLVRNSNTTAELAKRLANTTSYQRIALFSQGEIDAGQNNPSRIYLDYALKYTEWPEYDDEDGTSVITVTGESFYDSTAGKQFGVTVKTAMAAFA